MKDYVDKLKIKLFKLINESLLKYKNINRDILNNDYHIKIDCLNHPKSKTNLRFVCITNNNTNESLNIIVVNKNHTPPISQDNLTIMTIDNFNLIYLC